MKNNSFVSDYSVYVTDINDVDELHIILTLDNFYFNSDLSNIKVKTLLVFILSDFIKKVKYNKIRVRNLK